MMDKTWINSLKWEKKQWQHKKALIDKSSGAIILYIGQDYDKNYFELTEDGFSHDHCDECFKRIEDNTEYYESDNNIICENCFNESNN